MAIDLNSPIAWESPSQEERAMLRNLQGNILKGHGRDHVTLLFIRFQANAQDKARSFLRNVATAHAHDALTQLEQAKQFKATGEPGDVFVGIGLTASAYKFLGALDPEIPSDKAFRAGMRKRKLQDPALEKWESGLRDQIHAVVLIADDLQARVDDMRGQIETALRGAGKVAAREDGQVMRNKHGDGIEHFGYVDGRSQPLMLKEDIEEEKKVGIDQWDPTFGIGTALVPDPGKNAQGGFGSYLVFRKLEQDVRGFKANEKKLANALGLTGASEELAGALVIGRFEDGTPVALQSTDGLHPVPNNFGFAADPDGAKCPFAGHIRKANPRGDTTRRLQVPLSEERSHLIPRRGIPYGTRATHPSDPILDEHPELYPRNGVGLLFMAYNADLARQFEFVQGSWANNPQFVDTQGTGIDPVIGNGVNPRGLQKWPRTWGQPGVTAGFDFSGFVSMKGGEYFFAPCLAFLRNL